MKRVLIWDKNTVLKNTGGPSGYIFNIKEYLKNYPNSQISFYSDVLGNNNNDSNNKVAWYKRCLIELESRYKILQYIVYLKSYFSRSCFSSKEIEVLKNFDYVHFHNIFHYAPYSSMKKRQVSFILTLHSPEPVIDELTKSYGLNKLFSFFPFLRRKLIKKEIEILDSADHLMFPVKEACEVFINASKLYSDFFAVKNNIFYVPTALYPSDLVISDNKLNIDKQYSIPNDAIKLCFIGRHNTIKGYDRLKEIAPFIWEQYPNVYFIIGGKEEPLKGLRDNRWIELGWVNTYSVLEEIDAFVLPNKETYFDLILLEVLRQGKFCIISETGGNKWFKQYNLDGLKLFNYNDLNSLPPIIDSLIKAKNNNQIHTIEVNNQIFFLNHFTMNHYISNYLSAINNL